MWEGVRSQQEGDLCVILRGFPCFYDSGNIVPVLFCWYTVPPGLFFFFFNVQAIFFFPVWAVVCDIFKIFPHTKVCLDKV